MHSTIRELRIYDKAFERKQKITDFDNYLLGQYVFDAVSAALANAFSGKNKKAVSYQDVREKPLLQIMEEERKEQNGEMSDEEKKARTEAMFRNLEIMASNFRLAKAAKEREESESGEVS